MMMIIIIMVVIVKGVAADRWHWRRWGGGHRTVAAALAEAPKAGAHPISTLLSRAAREEARAA